MRFANLSEVNAHSNSAMHVGIYARRDHSKPQEQQVDHSKEMRSERPRALNPEHTTSRTARLKARIPRRKTTISFDVAAIGSPYATV
jgi:hypothetical protein